MAQSIEMKWDVLCDEDEWEEWAGFDWPSSSPLPAQPSRTFLRRLTPVFLLLIVSAWLCIGAPLALTDVNGMGAEKQRQTGFTEAEKGQVDSENRQTGAEAQSLAGDRLPTDRDKPFYAEISAAGQEIPPLVLNWGKEQRIRSEFFVIQYHPSDARATQAAIAHLDSRYLALRRIFGLPLPAQDAKIRVVVGLVPGFQDRGQQQIQLLSPARLPVPSAVSNGDLLLQSAQSVLVDWAIFEMLRAQRNPTAGQISSSLLNGLRLWSQWQMEGPLAESQPMQVRAALIPSQENAQPVLPLCQLVSLWRPESPGVDWGLPCQWLDAIATGRATAQETGQGVSSMVLLAPDWEGGSQRAMGGESIVLATFLDYATHTYGPGRLRLLLGAAGRFSSWETLIPAVFDVSVDEFEAGWRAWLAQEYGL